MLPAKTGRRVLMCALALFAAVALCSPVAAQSTGGVKGKVMDKDGQPIEGAKVTVDFKEGMTRHYELKTDKKGAFIQIGLPPGNYVVTAAMPKLGQQSYDVRVRLGDNAEINFVLAPGMTQPTKEDAAKTAAVRKLFEEGVAASKAGDHDTALAKFTEATTVVPNCPDCYYNIGYAHAQKKEYDKSEAAFLKAIELKADYVEAYNGLATVYNAQKKFKEAGEASEKAAQLAAATPSSTGAGVDALYNQGVIDWNAGKIAEAKAHFEEALKANPNHADSHYQLGMALLNEGKLPDAAGEFETYLKLAPDGQYAGQAKGILGTLKK